MRFLVDLVDVDGCSTVKCKDDSSGTDSRLEPDMVLWCKVSNISCREIMSSYDKKWLSRPMQARLIWLST